MGGGASGPNRPPCQMTPTAIGEGDPLAPGTKHVKTASSRLPLLMPFWAVPVLPSIVIPPVACGPAVAYAVPPALWVTSYIMDCTLPATVGETAWLSAAGVARWITDSP